MVHTARKGGDEIEVIERTIQIGCGSSISIYPLGDVHIGAIHCDEDAFEKQVDVIRRTKNAYWVGMGDMADCITDGDKRFDSCSIAPWVVKDDIIESQRKRLVGILAPIKEKCLCYLTGNHEESIRRYHRDDITKHIVDDLGVPYGSYAAFIQLHMTRPSSNERHMYTIHAWHGAGGAQTNGARVQRLMRLVMANEADIYFMGHLHSIESLPPAKLGVRNGRIKGVPMVATTTGSWLKTYMQGAPISYGECKGYMPSTVGCPIVTIHPTSNTISLHMSQQVSGCLSSVNVTESSTEVKE
ncbi:MAG: hypothetical protein WC479_12580 [Candidatus Izemoplasmatales bacterium]